MTTPRVSREQAELLKKVGYDVPHVYVYNNRGRLIYLNHAEGNFDFDSSGNLSAPTLDEAARWLREVKGWHCYADSNGKDWCWNKKNVGDEYHFEFSEYIFPTHDLALSAGIDLILKKLTEQ